jgi:hypothetical protein
LGDLGDPKKGAPNHTKVVFGEKWAKVATFEGKPVLRKKLTKSSDLDMV